jgi:hypothetical protein
VYMAHVKNSLKHARKKMRTKWSGYDYKTLVNPTPMSVGLAKSAYLDIN